MQKPTSLHTIEEYISFNTFYQFYFVEKRTKRTTNEDKIQNALRSVVKNKWNPSQ